ncbi:hypothetical protein OUZ56_012140 [Daphnia magna]|uniref:Uncharacterized protein n=1 Tax=Daphnia magna TaxID=35525 RepID=A0ABQ9Z2B5_9CRUS|nr:hypothetical protein OUZ56_012140 [Daphnia magna]
MNLFEVVWVRVKWNIQNGVKQDISIPPVGGAVGGAKMLLFRRISEVTQQLVSSTKMFRPELSLEQKISRVSAEKTMLKNVEKYTMNVAYGDSQRFMFEENGTISLYHKSEKENIPSTVLA